MRRALRLLLLESNPGQSLLVSHALSQLPQICHWTVVSTSETLLDYLHHRGPYTNAAQFPLPDLILLDWDLELANSPQVLKELKADPRLRIIPVVVLTGSRQEREVAASYNLGSTSFIVKPPSPEALLPMMRTFVQYWSDIVRLPFRASAT
ncbi:MAG: response regulator [Verrucomicrobiota bacterium]